MQLKYVSTLCLMYMYMYVDFYVGTCRTIRRREVTPIVDLLHITLTSYTHVVCICNTTRVLSISFGADKIFTSGRTARAYRN